MTIPAAISTVLGLLVDHVNTRVYIQLDTPGLSPDPLDTLPDGVWINGTKFSALEDTLLIAPQDGGVIEHIGPVKAIGSPGEQATVYVRNATAQLFLYGGAGDLLRELTLYCERPSYASVLATYNIVPRTSANPPLLDLSNGYLVPYPPVPEQDKFICYGIQYNASFGSSAYTLDASTCGGLGAYTEIADINSFTNSTTQLTFNATQITALKKQYPGSTSVDFTLHHFIFNVTEAIPASSDGAPVPVTTVTYALPSSGDLVIDIGENNIGKGLTFGPFTASGAAGDVLFFLPGSITATFDFKNSAGSKVGSSTTVLYPRVEGFHGPGSVIVPAGATKNPNLTGL